MILKQSNVLLFLYHKYPTTGTLSVTQSLQLSISQKQVLLFTTVALMPEILKVSHMKTDMLEV